MLVTALIGWRWLLRPDEVRNNDKIVDKLEPGDLDDRSCPNHRRRQLLRYDLRLVIAVMKKKRGGGGVPPPPPLF